MLHLLLLAGLLGADAPAKKPEDPALEPEKSVTTGRVIAEGRSIAYEATAGLMVLKDEEKKPKATFGYTAYVQSDVDSGRRPIVVAFNGGPGSASLWLHMGVLGPRRVEINDPEHTGPAPYAHVNNQYSVLSVADLVMMDPPGTGFSRVPKKEDGKAYWGVDQDAKACAEFIRWYLTEHQRWLSPKFVLGESYGGMRSGALVYQLMAKHNIDLNGVVLVSPFMSYAAGEDFGSSDLPRVLYLTGLAATAHYHEMVKVDTDFDTFLSEVDAFANSDYLLALQKGNRLEPAERARILDKLVAYTGVDREVWDRADLRMAHTQFLQEVQRKKGLTTGRIDARYEGPATNSLAENMDYDAYFSRVRAAYTAAFHDYMYGTLKFGKDLEYRVSAGLFTQWDMTHMPPGGAPFKLAAPDTGVDLEHTIKQNPTMRVLVQQGYYDLATPVGATNYFVDHMNLSPEERARVEVEYYDAGHMMYVHQPSLVKYAKDLRDFIRASLPPKK